VSEKHSNTQITTQQHLLCIFQRRYGSASVVSEDLHFNLLRAPYISTADSGPSDRAVRGIGLDHLNAETVGSIPA
jgi:hypothetical protein